MWNMVQEWLQTASLALEVTTAPTLARLHLTHVVLASSLTEVLPPACRALLDITVLVSTPAGR